MDGREISKSRFSQQELFNVSSSSKLLLGQSDFLPDEIILIEYIKIDLRCRRSVSPNFFEAKGNGIRRKKEEGRHGR